MLTRLMSVGISVGLLVVVSSLAASALAPEPSAASLEGASESPLTAWPGLVTEPIAPGVWRVLADADGRRFTSGRVREVAAGPDGTLWVAQGRRAVRLDDRGVVLPRDDSWRSTPRRLGIDAAGRLWAQEDRGTVVLAEDDGWLVDEGDSPSEKASLAISDGSAWRVVQADEPTVAMRGSTGWHVVDAPVPTTSSGGGAISHQIVLDASDRLWVSMDAGAAGGDLWCYADDTWSRPAADIIGEDRRILALASDRAGAVWLLTDRTGATVDGRSAYQLIRIDGDDRLVLEAGDGVPQRSLGAATSWTYRSASPLIADGDGGIWLSLPRIGLYRYDGAAFGRVDAPGLELGALDLAVDQAGHLWVASMRGGLFVIDREGIGPVS